MPTLTMLLKISQRLKWASPRKIPLLTTLRKEPEDLEMKLDWPTHRMLLQGPSSPRSKCCWRWPAWAVFTPADSCRTHMNVSSLAVTLHGAVPGPCIPRLEAFKQSYLPHLEFMLISVL